MAGLGSDVTKKIMDSFGSTLSKTLGGEGASKIAAEAAKMTSGGGVGAFMKSTGLDKLSNQLGRTNMIGHALDNLQSVGLKGGGEYMEAAIKGAAGGAALGGTSEWAQGGSFWGGAKRGLLPGAAVGTAGRAYKVAAGGNNWRDQKGFVGATGTHSGNYKQGHMQGAVEIGQQLDKSGISKPLDVILRNKKLGKTLSDVYGM